ncbi:MAG: acyl-CoA transferase [Rhodobacteraceae bacterium]|jgi:hypothetical protein|nr:acyl-CoA transferase [Paracoccaceae bacterium]
MPSKSESVLAALGAAIAAGLPAGADYERNGVLPAVLPRGGLVILRDGDPGEPEFLLSPLTYIYEHRAEVDIVVEGSCRDELFDALKVAIGTALAADRTLGGLCDWVEPEAPAPVELPVDGGEEIKAATIGVLLTYETSNPLT